MRIKCRAVAVPVFWSEYRLIPFLILLQGPEVGIPGLFIASGPEGLIKQVVNAGKEPDVVLLHPPGFSSNDIYQKIIVKLFLLQ